ncbi:MAG: hypothetical protein AAF657_23820 [Acidobacteriota bacterium]
MSLTLLHLSVFALLGSFGLFSEATEPTASSSSTVAMADNSEPMAHADLVGQWRGHLAVGEHRIRLVFDLRLTEDGDLAATLDSPDQGATGIPVAEVVLDGTAITLGISAIGAAFAGQLVDERQAIDGEWRQAGQALPLRVERGESAAP